MRRLFSPFFLPCLFFFGRAAGADFVIQSSTITPPETATLALCKVLCDDVRFEFIQPHDWQLTANAAAREVVLQPRARNFAITLRFCPHAEGEAAASPTADQLRPAVLAQFTGAEIRTEFVCYTGGQSGPAFDVDWVASERFPMASRVAMIPYAGGVMKLELTGPRHRFAETLGPWAVMVTSLRQASPQNHGAAVEFAPR